MLKTQYKIILTLAAIACVAIQVRAAESQAEKQQKYIAIIKSDAPPQEKAVPCKMLAVYGDKEAVPALAALLPNKDLSSWARIALEAIPDPAADEALRDAAGKLQGRLLIGVINSIGYRRDAKAVEVLVPKLKDADAQVASSAAAALGKIGGAQAAEALLPLLADAPVAVRPTVAEGCVVCAEGFLAAGNPDQAVKLYDAVRKADVPKQRILEGTRGAILARGAAGIPLLLEQLRSEEHMTFAMALRAARELRGGDVTDALIAELAKTPQDRQGLLILALADRNDPKALPAVLQAAKNAPTKVRVVAVTALEKFANVASVPVLLEAATDADAELATTAKTVLARLGGTGVDADIFARLNNSSGKARQVLIELAEQRRIEGAIPVFVKCAEDSDAGVRAAALVAIGSIGEAQNTADLVRLLQKAPDAARGDIEKSLIAISSRLGAACVQHLLPLAQSGDSATRVAAIRALACCGGTEALAAVKAAIADEAIQDEAVRTLSTWPNRWPDDGAVAEPLLTLAKSGKKPQHQVLALRAYLQYIQGAKKIGADQKLASVKQALPLITRPEEKRLAVSVLSAIPVAGALESLATFAADPGVSEEACSAIVGLTSKNLRGLSKEQRQKVLQVVVENSKSDATRSKAEQMLKE